jgi:hypothetical protein
VEKMWKEVVVGKFEIISQNFTNVLRKIARNLSQESLPSSRNSNPEHPKDEGTLPTLLLNSVR